MRTKSVKESVGQRNHGTINCCNRPDDVKIVVKLLNAISSEVGGTNHAPLSVPQRIGHRFSVDLARAIRDFQRRQNQKDLSQSLLSANGHVDPGDRTIRRLKQMASLAPEIQLPEIVARRNEEGRMPTALTAER